MLNRTLQFLTQKVTETLSPKSVSVLLSSSDVFSEPDKFAVKDTIALTLLNVNDDSFTRNTLINPFTSNQPTEPENAFFSLQLQLLFSAHSADYGSALSHIARIIGYFHLNPLLEMEVTTGQGAITEKVQVAMTLLPVNFEQANYLRSASGIGMKPFVCYKLRWNHQEANKHSLAYDD